MISFVTRFSKSNLNNLNNLYTKLLEVFKFCGLKKWMVRITCLFQVVVLKKCASQINNVLLNNGSFQTWNIAWLDHAHVKLS